MSASPDPTESNAVRESILDAAQARLLRFGYHKTTMTEIADDSGMSAANLYRYFKNKQDIVAECTVRFFDERLERLRAIVRDPALGAGEKLTRYALDLVDDSHGLIEADSMMGELVDAVTRERPDLVVSKYEIHYQLIAEVLEAGRASGEFAVNDPEKSAKYIFSAFSMFDVPVFVGLFDRSDFDDRAIGLVRLLVDGLRHGGAATE